MTQASKFFSAADLERIEAAIREAEGKTSAEIVVAVSTASGRYDRAEDMVGLWLGALVFLIAFFAIPFPEEVPDWGFSLLHLRCIVLLITFIVGFVGGAMVAARWLTLRRLFSPRSQMKDEVALRARQVFFDSSVHHTAGGSGMLIYLSLYEREAVLLADQAVLNALPSESLANMCARITEGMREGQGCDALCAVVSDAGSSLHARLPRTADDVDELSNRVVILD